MEDAARAPGSLNRRVVAFSNSGNPVRQQREVRLEALVQR
jgi:hypothetical protein